MDISTASTWAALIEEWYSDVESLDTTAYRWIATDRSERWTQARDPDADQQHLGIKLQIAGFPSIQRDRLIYTATATYSCRRREDDDSKSQSIMLATQGDLVSMLYRWSCGDIHTIPRASSVLTRTGDYLVTITFDLSIPRT